jgi:hypothetical protein
MGTRKSIGQCAGDGVENFIFSGVVGFVQICWQIAKGCYVLTA